MNYLISIEKSFGVELPVKDLVEIIKEAQSLLIQRKKRELISKLPPTHTAPFLEKKLIEVVTLYAKNNLKRQNIYLQNKRRDETIICYEEFFSKAKTFASLTD